MPGTVFDCCWRTKQCVGRGAGKAVGVGVGVGVSGSPGCETGSFAGGLLPMLGLEPGLELALALAPGLGRAGPGLVLELV